MQGMTMASPRPLKPQKTMACITNTCVLVLPGDHFRNTAVPPRLHNLKPCTSGVNRQMSHKLAPCLYKPHNFVKAEWYAVQQIKRTGSYLTKGCGQAHSAGHDAPQEAAASHDLGPIILVSHQAAQGRCEGLQDSRHQHIRRCTNVRC